MENENTQPQGAVEPASTGYVKAELNRRVDYCDDQWTGANNALTHEAYALAADLMEKCVSQMKLCIHDCRALTHNVGDQV